MRSAADPDSAVFDSLIDTADVAAAAAVEGVCNGAATQLPQHTFLLHATTVSAFNTGYAPADARKMQAPAATSTSTKVCFFYG